MSKSSRQLTLFDCAEPLSKRSRVKPAHDTRSSKVAAASIAISHVHADISDLSDEDSSVSSIRTDFSMQPQTPSPRCTTPIFISSSSDETLLSGISATFSPCKEPPHLGDNTQHLTTTTSNSCNESMENMPRSTETLSYVPTTTSATCTTCLTSSSITVTHSTCTHLNSQSQPGQISLSYAGVKSAPMNTASHDATVSEVDTATNISYSEPDRQPNDIAQTPVFPPVRPVHIKFPATTYGIYSRSFNPQWYERFHWLEYSVMYDACFCYPCRMFGSTIESSSGRSRPEPVFTSTGFRDWKHATGKTGALSRHSSCYSHKQAELAWSQYKLNSKKGTTIAERLGSARSVTITQNRHYIGTIADIILLCSRQEIALRGHRESSDSMNRGNFLEILHFIAKRDPGVKERLENGPKNAKYTSPEIQNSILHIMAGILQQKISLAAKQAGVYSILADETKDCSKVEQLAIVLRYVEVSTACVHEHFLTYVKAESLNAEGLSSYILDTLQKFGLDPKNIVSQGYDGASVMSGHCSGVQQHIKAVAPMAVYVHCYAHCLNLVLVDSTKSVAEASEFFALLEMLYVFMSASKAHTIFVQQQSVLHPGKPVRELQQLSDTRWACRFDAVDAICSTFDAILLSLQTIMDGNDKVKAVEASGIYMQIHSFKFLTTLVLFLRILSCTKGLSDKLQCSHINMAKAAELVTATTETLQHFRSDAEWSKMYKYVGDVATLHNIRETSLRPQRQKRLPKRLNDAVVMETTGSRNIVSNSENFKVCLYYPILDAMITELQRRFDNKNLELMTSFQCCVPESPHFLDIDHLLPAAEFYELNKDSLAMECVIAKRTLKEKNITTINDVLSEIVPLKEAFPVLVKLLQIALTVVVSTAECERSFSSLRRTKTYLRSTMSEQRLVDLAVLSIEKELSKNLSLDEVIDKFAAQDRNRRIMLS